MDYMDRLAATVYIFIILGVVAFQFCLVAGDFWGENNARRSP